LYLYSMKIFTFILIAIYFSASSQAELKKTAEINCSEKTFLTDHMGNVYIVSGKNIIKYSHEGEKLYEYSNNRLGNIDASDVSDPLRIMLFYHDFNQLVFLNKELAEISEPILIDDLGAGQAETACASSSGGFWIYSSNSQQILYFNKNLEQVYQSENLSALTGSDEIPVFMTEQNGMLYVSIPENGVLLFDQFGTYFKTIPIKNLHSFQVFDNELVYFADNRLKAYNYQLLEFSDVSELTIESDYARIQNNRLFVLKENKINAYE